MCTFLELNLFSLDERLRNTPRYSLWPIIVFFLYINDFPDQVDSQVCVFADDVCCIALSPQIQTTMNFSMISRTKRKGLSSGG